MWPPPPDSPTPPSTANTKNPTTSSSPWPPAAPFRLRQRRLDGYLHSRRAHAQGNASRFRQPALPKQSRRHIYRRDRQIRAGDRGQGWAQGVCVGDYNNDGWEDLFVTYYGQNRLYRNNGNGTFTNVTEKAGLLHPGTRYSTGCTFVGLQPQRPARSLRRELSGDRSGHAPKPSLEVPNCNYEGVPVNCGPRACPRRSNISTATTATALLPMFPRSPAWPRCTDRMA